MAHSLPAAAATVIYVATCLLDAGAGGAHAADSDFVQIALTAAAQAGGGSVVLQAGVYTIHEPLKIGSNTTLRCRPGAVIYATGQYWRDLRGTMPEIGNRAAVINVHFDAVSTADHDITIEDCAFREDDTFSTDGGFHAISFRRARNILITGNSFSAGGDATALIATDRTRVIRNDMIGALNACWDHWDAPRNGIVRHNTCASFGYGTLITGTDTANKSAGLAENFRVSDNYYQMKGAMISGNWVQGYGAPGSGAKYIHIARETFHWPTEGAQQNCIKVSGNTSGVVISKIICDRGYISVDWDSGGVPRNVSIKDARISSFLEGKGAPSPLTVYAGNHVILERNCILRAHGRYAFGITLGHGNLNILGQNMIEQGYSGIIHDMALDTIYQPPVKTPLMLWCSNTFQGE